MKKFTFLRISALFLTLLMMQVSCVHEEDPGPLQSEEKNYVLQDFDRLDIGYSFVITVQQSPVFSILVRGDRRNLDDLGVIKVGSTLNIRYTDNRSHEHTTYITITMPALAGASLSGASNTTMSGFKDADNMDIILSGAAIAQLNIESKKSTINLSGASKLTLSGKTDAMDAKISGASELSAYAMNAMVVDADASGAGKISVFASQSLKANASGAGIIYYKGNPLLNATVSGAGMVKSE
ncbi:MAG: DUF2807 domain-containing protein [Cyclobacteriaceae bacterium]|nr:DUF2807 domain-containing protein [Cyclobacteriaceae bacterium]